MTKNENEIRLKQNFDPVPESPSKEEKRETKVNQEPISQDQSSTEQIDSDKNTITKADVTHFVKPYVNTYSGTEPVPKNESTFEEWKIEIEYLIKSKGYHEVTVKQTIKNSLKGQARKVLVTLGPNVTNEGIRDKVESVFGNVASGKSVLQEFHTAAQKPEESVTLWGIRDCSKGYRKNRKISC